MTQIKPSREILPTEEFAYRGFHIRTVENDYPTDLPIAEYDALVETVMGHLAHHGDEVYFHLSRSKESELSEDKITKVYNQNGSTVVVNGKRREHWRRGELSIIVGPLNSDTSREIAEGLESLHPSLQLKKCYSARSSSHPGSQRE